MCQLCCNTNQIRCINRVVDVHVEKQRQVPMFLEMKIDHRRVLLQDCSVTSRPERRCVPLQKLDSLCSEKKSVALSERYPVPYPSSPGSTVELNDLHFDEQMPGNADVKVSGETVTREGSNFLRQVLQENDRVPTCGAH